MENNTVDNWEEFFEERRREIRQSALTLWKYEIKWELLAMVGKSIDINLKATKKFNSESENMLTKLNAETDEKFTELVNNGCFTNIPKEQMPGHLFIFYPHLFINSELERQQRFSICISIFSFHESYLKTICNFIEEEFPKKIRLSDLNGNNDLGKYWAYLTKVFEIDTSSLEPYHTRLTNQKITRNKITHEDGLFSDPTKFKPAPGLELSERNRVEIKSGEYAEYLLGVVSGYFRELLISVDKRYIELKAISLAQQTNVEEV